MPDIATLTDDQVTEVLTRHPTDDLLKPDPFDDPGDDGLIG
jgi:hypothetical protein